MHYIYNNVTLRRLNAERNILPEEESDLISLSPDGSGASNLIRKFINNSTYDEKAIEILLLAELNKIMNPEAFYSSIRVQQVEISEKIFWEIFLEENSVGRFALSQSGSGLKTVILILLNLWIIPLLPEYKYKTIYYAFEEPLSLFVSARNQEEAICEWFNDKINRINELKNCIKIKWNS